MRNEGFFDRVPPETAAGCYECQRLFSFGEVAEFWDDGEIPVCPYCGRDSVVIESADMRVTPDQTWTSGLRRSRRGGGFGVVSVSARIARRISSEGAATYPARARASVSRRETVTRTGW